MWLAERALRSAPRWALHWHLCTTRNRDLLGLVYFSAWPNAGLTDVRGKLAKASDVRPGNLSGALVHGSLGLSPPGGLTGSSSQGPRRVWHGRSPHPSGPEGKLRLRKDRNPGSTVLPGWEERSCPNVPPGVSRWGAGSGAGGAPPEARLSHQPRLPSPLRLRLCSSSPLPSTPGTKVRGPQRVRGDREWRRGIVGGGEGHRGGSGFREGASA